MAVATLAQIRAGLNTRLATISGVQTYAYLPAQPTVPCAFVGGPRQVTYNQTMQTGLNEWTMIVWVLVSTAVPSVEAQTDLDQFVSPTGSLSVRAAIEGDPTLGGVVADTIVDSSDGYSFYVTESGSFFGAQFVVRVAAAV